MPSFTALIPKLALIQIATRVSALMDRHVRQHNRFFKASLRNLFKSDYSDVAEELNSVKTDLLKACAELDAMEVEEELSRQFRTELLDYAAALSLSAGSLRDVCEKINARNAGSSKYEREAYNQDLDAYHQLEKNRAAKGDHLNTTMVRVQASLPI